MQGGLSLLIALHVEVGVPIKHIRVSDWLSSIPFRFDGFDICFEFSKQELPNRMDDTSEFL